MISTHFSPAGSADAWSTRSRPFTSTEEGRPIETVWDVTVAATAHARSVPHTDKRLEIERAAGDLLKTA